MIQVVKKFEMASSNYLEISFTDHKENTEKIPHYNFRNKPFSNSDVFLAPVKSFELLTRGNDVKRVYNLKLCTKGIPHNFLPGDTMGVLPHNNDTEVNEILIRLKSEQFTEETYTLQISKKTSKKNPTLPKHIPSTGVLKDIFLYYVDIRKPPKKMLLKALIPFTDDIEEIKLLQRITSPAGSKEYSDFINEKASTLLGLLNAVPSCNPPVQILLEHLLPLQPRYYSIASSPLLIDEMHITFFVVDNADGTRGVCTGWLEDIIREGEENREKVPFYFRKPNNFQIPEELSTPLIMISTGTGVAPFIGFLQHLLLSKTDNDGDSRSNFLFHGCRYADRDFLFKSELQNYLQEKVLTKLYTAFSRSRAKKHYVQDEITKNGEEFINSVLRNKAVIYVCGDTKTVVKGVKDAVVRNFILYGNLDETSAQDYLNTLVEEKRFIADCWS